PVPLRRRQVVALRGLSLDIPAGTVYGLLGPNGSGKSTTLKILLGLVNATSGTSEIFGVPSSRVASRTDVGFLPENPYFYKFLTGAETISFYGKLCGLGGKALRSRVKELLELVGLTESGDRRISGYSKGMLQRIGLAQAMVHDPRLLILDEPTAGVDPAGSRQIRDLILQLKARGKTILLTSHLLEQVQEVCDRVGILAKGHLVREGALDILTRVTGQTEFIIENAGHELQEEIARLAASRGARLVTARQPQLDLETVFLQATEAARPPGV
ncbi:MAG: ABC transporter ATP-binding protein, partial [Verrucomicrobia bacterium]|nr:ABC transporter ATP-binding protein [Verrucomicrobiota bacterium]